MYSILNLLGHSILSFVNPVRSEDKAQSHRSTAPNGSADEAALAESLLLGAELTIRQRNVAETQARSISTGETA